jgi:transcriptional regulator with XRE-family HTH domain
MGRTKLEQQVADRQRALRRAVGEELRRVREDEGLSLRSVSAAAGYHHSHLPRIETGDRDGSLDAVAAFAAAMGHQVSLRLFPTTGPRVRDHLQVRMIEALLAALHPRWVPRLEVPVYRPARGVIDVVLQDRATSDIVAGEGHSTLATVERQLRWAGQKADSLPSADGWPWARTVEPPRVSRFLLLRSTRAMHELVGGLPEVFRAAYPADPGEAYASLTGGEAGWPGAAILWVDIDGAATTILHGLPRALRGTRG